MTQSKDSRGLTAADVLRRYKDEDLPAFCDVQLKDVNQTGNFGERPLQVACTRGFIEEIAALIEGGAEVNAPGELGNTPLHEAVSQGHAHAIRFLLDHGASTAASNEFGQTPIDIARSANQFDVAALLESHRTGHA
jgi:ankyrin repeat protein